MLRPNASVQGKKAQTPESFGETRSKHRGLAWLESKSQVGRLMKGNGMNRYAKTIVIALCAVLLTVSRCIASEEDWTVVTLSRNGAWGVASASSQPVAMAAAITSCRVMASATSECGAQFRAARGEWVIANLCGSHKVIAVGRSLDDAEREALNFEISLQLVYAPDLPPCKRVVTVDPNGAVVRPGQEYSAALQD
jgi:hypothetical protein